MRKTLRYSDLKDQILHPEAKGEILYCPSCQNEFSANAGDYWQCSPDDILECGDCNTPFQLVRKVVSYRRVK